MRVAFYCLVLIKMCQRDARIVRNLRFVIFIWNPDLRMGCVIGVRVAFSLLLLILKGRIKGAVRKL